MLRFAEFELFQTNIIIVRRVAMLNRYNMPLICCLSLHEDRVPVCLIDIIRLTVMVKLELKLNCMIIRSRLELVSSCWPFACPSRGIREVYHKVLLINALFCSLHCFCLILGTSELLNSSSFSLSLLYLRSVCVFLAYVLLDNFLILNCGSISCKSCDSSNINLELTFKLMHATLEALFTVFGME